METALVAMVQMEWLPGGPYVLIWSEPEPPCHLVARPDFPGRRWIQPPSGLGGAPEPGVSVGTVDDPDAGAPSGRLVLCGTRTQEPPGGSWRSVQLSPRVPVLYGTRTHEPRVTAGGVFS